MSGVAGLCIFYVTLEPNMAVRCQMRLRLHSGVDNSQGFCTKSVITTQVCSHSLIFNDFSRHFCAPYEGQRSCNNTVHQNLLQKTISVK